VKRSLQFMLFPEGIGYDFKNDRLRTFRVNSIFTAIASISDKLKANKNGTFQNDFEKSRLVTSTGQSSSFISLNILSIIDFYEQDSLSHIPQSSALKIKKG
jgi:hypothetical protein